MTLKTFILTLLATLALWFGMGNMGCTAASRTHWVNAGDYGVKALDNTGGAVVEVGKAVALDGATLIDGIAQLIEFIQNPVMGVVKSVDVFGILPGAEGTVEP